MESHQHKGLNMGNLAIPILPAFVAVGNLSPIGNLLSCFKRLDGSLNYSWIFLRITHKSVDLRKKLEGISIILLHEAHRVNHVFLVFMLTGKALRFCFVWVFVCHIEGASIFLPNEKAHPPLGAGANVETEVQP